MENYYARLRGEASSKVMEISRMERTALELSPLSHSLSILVDIAEEMEKRGASFLRKFTGKKAHEIHKLVSFRDACSKNGTPFIVEQRKKKGSC